MLQDRTKKALEDATLSLRLLSRALQQEDQDLLQYRVEIDDLIDTLFNLKRRHQPIPVLGSRQETR